MKVLDLFSGIGGFSLGLERAGFETVAFCEIEKYPQKVLRKHWPDVPIYEDVRELTYDRLKSDGITGIDVITGGFPCQDISVAGKQAGITDETRSGLWSECARLLGEIRPRYAIFENVTALLSGDNGRWFQRVLWDISEVGYDAEWHCIPASELGAHHHRDRVWIICYPNSYGYDELRVEKDAARDSGWKTKEVFKSKGTGNPEILAYPNSIEQPVSIDGGEFKRSGEATPERTEPFSGRGCKQFLSDTASGGCQESEKPTPRIFKGGDAWWRSGDRRSGNYWFASLSGVRRVTDGVSNQSHRIKALGNSVVPQIPELIGRAIMETNNE